MVLSRNPRFGKIAGTGEYGGGLGPLDPAGGSAAPLGAGRDPGQGV